LTTVAIKDGSATAFWNDVWHMDEALADRFPAIYSHCTRKEVSVREAVLSNLHNAFVPRLSNQATVELQQINAIIEQTALSQGNDLRKSQFDCGHGKLDSSSIYKLLKARQQPADPTSDFIWKNSVPPRIQFFMWLVSKGRIQCRANLCKKRIVSSPGCEICGATEETTDHIILHCPFARSFWNALGLTVTDDLSAQAMHTLPKIQALPLTQYSTFFAMCCWQLWKRRNALIFRNETLSIRQVLQACCLDAAAWQPRIPRKQRQVADAWCLFLQERINQSM
jgi:hypothetical protein